MTDSATTPAVFHPIPSSPPLPTEDQRSRRLALRAAKLARKQREAAERRRVLQCPEDEAADDTASPWDGSASAKWGNFHHYYNFNQVEDRIDFLTPTFYHAIIHPTPNPHVPNPPLTSAAVAELPSACFCPTGPLALPAVFPPPSSPHSPASVYVLDLGCNSGELTIELTRRLHSSSPLTHLTVVGIDIDPDLIQRARDRWKAESGQPPSDVDPRISLSFYQANLVCPVTLPSLASLLPQSASSPSSLSPTPRVYHLICCFSLLMWIHLCYGTSTLRSFLTSVASLSSHLLIEWQGWRHYRQAIERRRRAHLDEGVWVYPSIEEEWRGDRGRAAMTRVIEDAGMRERAVLGKTKWGREVIWFSRVEEEEEGGAVGVGIRQEAMNA